MAKETKTCNTCAHFHKDTCMLTGLDSVKMRYLAWQAAKDKSKRVHCNIKFSGWSKRKNED